MTMDMIQTTNASLPVAPAIPPIENRTSGGTPAATQKAPFQSNERISPPPDAASDPSDSTIATISSLLDQFYRVARYARSLVFMDRFGGFPRQTASYWRPSPGSRFQAFLTGAYSPSEFFFLRVKSVFVSHPRFQ